MLHRDVCCGKLMYTR